MLNIKSFIYIWHNFSYKRTWVFSWSFYNLLVSSIVIGLYEFQKDKYTKNKSFSVKMLVLIQDVMLYND